MFETYCKKYLSIQYFKKPLKNSSSVIFMHHNDQTHQKNGWLITI